MLPHDFLPEARALAMDARLFDILGEAVGEEVLLAYSMFYFKPPGARGQAFHQDNFYIRVKPAACHAAWIAVDPSDEGNGGLKVVPRSHRLEIVCPEEADPANYFAKELVRPPAGYEPVQLRLDAGDALFFHGNLIHGSDPNRSSDRFRRSFICHYMPASSAEIARYDVPPLDRHGRPHAKKDAEGGGPCGTPHASVAH
jgi:ectoine hydroxylase-related dioxygenase (phytanoyl-CoA dioxygenase family)